MKKLFTIVLLLASLVGFAQQMSNGASNEKTENGAKVSFLYEDFESFSIPGNMFGWTIFQTNATSTWQMCTGGAHSGTNYIGVIFDVNFLPQDETIVTSTMNLTGTIDPQLSFWFRCNSRTLAIDSGYSDLSAAGNISAVTGWTLWHASTDPNWVDGLWYYVNIPLGGSFANQSTAFFGLRFTASAIESYAVPMYIDDLQVYDDAMGIEGAEGMISIQTYPNPATDFVCFAAEQKILEISLYNSTGALVITQNPERTQVQMNISQFSEGLYIAKIRTEEGVATKTINITR